MKYHTLRYILLMTVSTFVLMACGGGSSGSGAGGGGGGAPSAVSSGEITALGSIWVNGVRYSTTTSAVTVDDNPGVESDLVPGMTVLVRGSISDDGINGTATSVTADSVVKGPITTVYSSGTQTIGVMGQTVRVSAGTIIDNSISSLGSLTAGTELKVHGNVISNGVIDATLIEDTNVALTEYKVIGFAQSSTDPFTIGGLTVDIVPATIVSDLAGGLPAAGQLVEVKGAAPGGLSGLTLTASKVEPAGVADQNHAHVEVEGFVTSFTSSSSFTVGNTPVTTDGATNFEGGLPDEIQLFSKLEVEGQLVGGSLIADKVKFKYNVKIEGNVASYAGGSMTIVGLNGVTITVDGLTEGDTGAAVGNEVRVRGYETGTQAVTATRIDDRGPSSDPTPRTILQGVVDSEVTGTSVTILGILVNTTGIPETEFKNANDVVIGSAGFYNIVDPAKGTLVKVRGDFNGVSVVWDQAEIED